MIWQPAHIFLALAILLFLLFFICLVNAFAIKARRPAEYRKAREADPKRVAAYASSLSKMIQIETISSVPEGALDKFYKFHKLLEKLFPLLHKHGERHEFDGSLLFRWPGGGEPPVLLMSHHDVVEASGSNWSYPPFSGAIAGGRVWGRGAMDTKGSLFAILQAVEDLMASGYQPRGDIYIASSCNEETSGAGAQATANWLLGQGVRLGLVIDEGGAIMNDPMPGVKGTFAMIGVLEKGYADVKFVARGPGGHSSIQISHTPLAQVGKFIVDVEAHDPFTPKMNDTVSEMLRRLAPYMDFGMRFVFANLWLFKPLLSGLLGKISPSVGAMIKTTVCFTMAKGSDGLNVVPNEAYVTGNLRFSPHQDRMESLRIMRGIAARYGLETEVMISNDACKVVSHKSPAFRRVSGAVNDVFPGVVVTPYAMTGATDARFYGIVCDNLLRLSPILCDDGQLEAVHSYDENVTAAALTNAVDFYKNIIMRR